MKFYNPFKFHICSTPDERFVARKWTFLLGWVYLETKQEDLPYTVGGTWSIPAYVPKYCFNTLENVEAAIKGITFYKVVK